MAFVVWLELARYSLTESIQSPTSISYHLRLHLNAFRGEPAITEFDWHFTSTHSSSDSFAALTGSGLHSELIGASPWPWVAHPASGLIHATLSPKNQKTFGILQRQISDSLSLRLRHLSDLTSYID